MELADETVEKQSMETEDLKEESDDFTRVAESDEPTCKRCKLTISDCWNFFTRIGIEKDGIESAKCNACGELCMIRDRLDGTSVLISHIQQCDEIDIEDVRQMVLDTEAQLKYPEIFQLVVRKMSVSLVLEHDFPVGTFNQGSFVRWMKYINPNLVPISSDTIRADVLKIHMREKEKLKQTLASIPNRICLTSYLWTTITTEVYVCLSAHFVDSNWKLNSKILDFGYIYPTTGFEISSKIQECLSEWGIEKRIFSLTYDNDPDNDGMQEILKTNLSKENWLLCDGELFNVKCCTHILDLAVKEGLEACHDVLDKIRRSVAYVMASKSRRMEFRKCVATDGGKGNRLELRRDNPTRLSSTYLMLECNLKQQSAFANFQEKDHDFKCCPSVEEWKRAEKMYKFLLPFYDITKLFSDTSYPTSNLYFLQIHQIQVDLQESLNNEDEAVRSVAEKTLIEFKPYWEEYSVVLGLAAVLDPRIKLSSLEFLFSLLDPSTSREKTAHVKTNLYKLFEGYTNKNNIISSTTSNVQSVTPSCSHSAPSSLARLNQTKPRIFGALKHHELALRTGKSQLDVYLDEPTLNFDYYEDLDVLEWWKFTQKRFPELSMMACDLLSIPITNVASKSDFSIGARVLRKYRSSELSKNVQAFICGRMWLRGFDCEDEEEEECDCDIAYDDDEDEDEDEDEDDDDDDHDHDHDQDHDDGGGVGGGDDDDAGVGGGGISG